MLAQEAPQARCEVPPALWFATEDAETAAGLARKALAPQAGRWARICV